VINLKPNGTKNGFMSAGADDLGVINITGGTSTPKIVLTGNVKSSKLTIAAAHELDMASYTATVTESGTGASRPFVNSGVFTPSTGTFAYTGNTASPTV